MVGCGGSEVPQHRLGTTGEQRVPGHLVAERPADPGLRDIPNVVEVEEQKRATVARLKRGTCTPEPVRTQSVHIDAHLVVDQAVSGGWDLRGAKDRRVYCREGGIRHVASPFSSRRPVSTSGRCSMQTIAVRIASAARGSSTSP